VTEPVVVDARGLRCPLPVIRAAAAAREADPGVIVRVLWTDPAARHDIPAWARMRGHQVLETAEVETDDSAGPDADGRRPAWSTAVRIC
jgi:tRNA 2-thiouridine synthesizing protein A